MNEKLRILLAAASTPLLIWLFHAFVAFTTDLVKLLPDGRIRRLLLWRTQR
jgi:hypothetical protein